MLSTGAGGATALLRLADAASDGGIAAGSTESSAARTPSAAATAAASRRPGASGTPVGEAGAPACG